MAPVRDLLLNNDPGPSALEHYLCCIYPIPNPNPNSNIIEPDTSIAKVEYEGSLQSASWLSFVDVSENGGDSEPCCTRYTPCTPCIP